MDEFLKKYYKYIMAVIMIFFVSVSVLNAKNDAATYDEIAHIPAGYSYLTQQDYRLNPEHPPLLKDLAGLPLKFLNLKFDTTQAFWTGDLPGAWDGGQWEAGKHLLYQAGNNPDTILFFSRLPIVIISVILGLFLFMWARELAGLKAGLFIYILYSFDPNILGHNHYVTTDLGIAAFFTFAFYFFIKFIKNPTWKNVALAGIFLGLANLTKFSSVIAYPVLGLVLVAYPLIKNISHDKKENADVLLRGKTFLSYIGKGLVAFGISAILIWVVYKFNTYKMPPEVIAKQIEFSFPLSDPNIKSIYANKTLTFLNSSSLLRPFTDYMLGVFMVFKRVAGGNGAYFMGQVSNQAFPLYFPVVFLIKETIPFLFLIVFSLAYTIAQFAKKFQEKTSLKERVLRFARTGVTEYTTFLFISLYAYLSVTGNLNIGLRHLFPILPFAYLLVTKKVFDLIKNNHLITQRTFQWASLVIIFWIIIIPILNYPSYVSYFNETVGGSKNGYKYVTDSNTDWGQDLKRLNDWISEHNQKAQTRSCTTRFKGPYDCIKIDKIRTDYFGGGNPLYYLGDKYTAWGDSTRPIEPGWYALSANYLQGSIYDKQKSDESSYRWTEDYKPVTMIGNSILIYNIKTPPAK